MRPLREGVISDYDMTERMLKEFIKKVTSFRLFKAPGGHLRPLRHHRGGGARRHRRGHPGGARRVYSLRSLVAAAIGAGIDIAKPDGHMVVDIGGGTADIAVISLSGVVESASIKIAGDQFDEAVVKYISPQTNVLIGDRTAEELKMQIGCVFPPAGGGHHGDQGPLPDDRPAPVFSVTSSEMIEAFEEVSTRILEAIHGVWSARPRSWWPTSPPTAS